jgi:hypothetical protein
MSGNIKHKQRSCYSYRTNREAMRYAARKNYIRASRIAEQKNSKGMFAKLIEATKKMVSHRTTEK